MPQLGFVAVIVVEAGAASVVVVASVVVTASVVVAASAVVDVACVYVVSRALVVTSALVIDVVVEGLQGEAIARGASVPIRAIRRTDLTVMAKSGSN